MKQNHKTPIIFVGHGSPMNAIEENRYTKTWKEIGATLEKPRAIVMFSAHWITEGFTAVSSAKNPQMIYDMYGFPEALYQVSYPAQGDPQLAGRIISLFASTFRHSEQSEESLSRSSTKNSDASSSNIKEIPTGGQKYLIIDDLIRGYDHGVWSTLIHFFPLADVPVVTVSLDYHMDPQDLLRIGAALAPLRDEGVLIMGSGNIVHNLRAIDWTNQAKYPWAIDFDNRVAGGLDAGSGSQAWDELIDFESWDETRFAQPSWDHLLPLFPLMGAGGTQDRVSYFAPGIEMGSLSMRGVIWKNSEQ